MKPKVLPGKVKCYCILYAGLGYQTPASGIMQKRTISGKVRVCYKRRHRLLSLFSLAKQRLRCGVIAVYKNIRGSSSREGKEPFKLKDNIGTG